MKLPARIRKSEIKAEAVDPERFEATYQEWENMTIEALENLQKTGLSPMKVIVLADEFRQWCKIHEQENSAPFRSAFAAELSTENRAIIA